MDLFLEHLADENPNVVTAAAETLQVLGAGEFDKVLVRACLKGHGEMLENPVVVPDPNSEDSEATIAMDRPCHNIACLDLLKQCLISDGKYNKRHQNLVMKIAMDPARLCD